MQQALPPSIHPDTGDPYKWIHSPKDIAVAIIPEWILELMLPNYEDTKSLVPQLSIPRIISSYSGKPSEADRAREFLKYIDASKADGYGDWIGVGMTLASIDDSLLPDWIEFSRRSPKFVNEHDCEKRWKSANWKKITSIMQWVNSATGLRQEDGSPSQNPNEALRTVKERRFNRLLGWILPS